MTRRPSIMLPIGCAALLLAACGEPPQQWTLDTSEWPSCSWPQGTMVYVDWVDVRRHDLSSGDDQVVWSAASLRAISGLPDPEPTDLSLSHDRRWLTVTLQPPSDAGRPRLFALSCDGQRWAHIGPADMIWVSWGLISPDGRHLALNFHGESTIPTGVLILDLDTGDARKLADYGRPRAWSPKGDQLLYSWFAERGDEKILFGVATVDGDAPEYRGTTRLLDSAVAWDGDPGSVFYSKPGGAVRYFFDETKPPERISPAGYPVLRFDPHQGTLYGSTFNGLYSIDMVAVQETSLWSLDRPKIYDFAF